MWNVVLAEFPAEGIFWLLVVVVTLIARAVRAARESGQPQQNRAARRAAPADAPRSAGEPSQELQDFLRNLTGEHPSPRPPPPPPPARAQHRPTTVARPTPPRVRRETAQRPEPSREVRRPGSSQPQEPSAQARRVVAARTARTVKKAEPERKHAARLRREHIIHMLKARNTLRDAIVLREVIGPPTALR